MDGTMILRHGDLKLRYKLITARPQKPEPKPKSHVVTIRKTWIPPTHHPWRHFTLAPRPKKAEELVTTST